MKNYNEVALFKGLTLMFALIIIGLCMTSCATQTKYQCNAYDQSYDRNQHYNR